MKRLKKIFNYNLLILFIAIILLPVLNSFTKTWEFERKSENRVFKDDLSININHLDKFPKNCEHYINDNFSFRTPLLDLYHNVKFYFFKISPHKDKTIIGKKNWYFMAKKEKDIYEGKCDFSDDDLKKFKNEWCRRKKYLDSLNIKCHWIIAPIKHYIYSEYLPKSIKKSSKISRVEQIENYLKKDFPDLIIDPSQKLLEAKKNNKLYYQLDNHWNLYSGYLVSKQLLEKIKLDFPDKKIKDIPEYQWKDSTLQMGIHYRVLGIKELSEKDKFPILKNQKAKKAKKYKFPPLKNFPYPWEYELRYTNKYDKSNLKILVIRDSFGKKLIPFLKESFKESVFIFDGWQFKLNKKIIETVKPDIVVFIGLEKNIEKIIN